AVRAAEPGRAGRWQRDLDLLLAERDERARAEELVPIPARVPASRFKDYVTDAASVARSLRRPMPERPYRATLLGTLFHRWLEQRAGVAGSLEELERLEELGQLEELNAPWTERDGRGFVAGLDEGLDEGLGARPDEGPGAEPARRRRFAELRATFERSEWAGRVPVEVEREIELVLDGQVVVCKLDAVYALPGGRFEIVDWKTGRAPRDAQDLAARQFQLALYRLAYARWRGIDPERVDAAFYFVADDAVVRPERLPDERELVAAWRAAVG
ncbi:MAG: PD-(D/E)XK nuclease family protein, partial [Microbacteriaceae bacterium]